MNVLKKSKKLLQDLHGKPPREAIRVVKDKALFKARRLRNMARERRYMAWAPDQKELLDCLTKENQNRFSHLPEIFSIWENRLKEVFLPVGNDNFKQKFKRDHPEEEEMIFTAASEAAKGRLVLFRAYHVNLGSNIHWHSTIINENIWPLVYFRQIPTRNSATTGDLRTTWELNRHLHWLTLGKAYFLSGSSEHFDVFWNQFEGWTKENPYLMGVNWISAMEVAIRLNHWLAAYTLFCDCPDFGKESKVKFWCWVYLHIHYLQYHLTSEDRGFRNNHLIMEGATLFLAGILFGEFKEASFWEDKGYKVLTEELKMQFLSDGTHEELCSSYILQVCEAYLYTTVIAERMGLRTVEKWRQDINKMLSALFAIAKPDRNLPLLGDGDEGTFLGLSVDRSRMNIRTIADIAWMWGNTGGTPVIQEHPSEGAFWFVGPVKPIPSRRETAETLVLDNAQFAIYKETSRQGYHYCIFSASIKEPIHNYGHRHGDLLSVNLALFGNDIFVDPGTYCYNGPLDLRNYFQSTPAHNTVTLNGRSQIDYEGHFGIERIDYCSDLKVFDYGGVKIFRGQYIDKGREVWHCRYIILMMPDFIVIHDFCGEGISSDAQLNFTFAEDISVSEEGEYIICGIGEGRRIRIDLSSGHNSFRQAGKLKKTYMSPSYWIKKECHSLAMTSKGPAHCFTTIVDISLRGSHARHYLQASDHQMEESIILRVPGRNISMDFLHCLRMDDGSVDLRNTSSQIRIKELTAAHSIEFDPRLNQFVTMR